MLYRQWVTKNSSPFNMLNCWPLLWLMITIYTLFLFCLWQKRPIVLEGSRLFEKKIDSALSRTAALYQAGFSAVMVSIHPDSVLSQTALRMISMFSQTEFVSALSQIEFSCLGLHSVFTQRCPSMILVCPIESTMNSKKLTIFQVSEKETDRKYSDSLGKEK